MEDNIRGELADIERRLAAIDKRFDDTSKRFDDVKWTLRKSSILL